jgi:O-acetylserine/cysteine efflux transporter
MRARKTIKNKREIVGLLLLSVLWGSTWAAIRVTVTHMPPLRSVALRFLLASAVLVPVMLARRSRLPQGREWALLAVLGSLMLALPFALVAWTQQRIHTGMTSILFATAPLLTLWMETWLGGPDPMRRLPPRAVLGTVVGLLGVVAVLIHAASGLKGEIGPAVVVLLTAALGSAGSIIAKQLLKEIPVLTVAGVQTAISGLILGALSLATERQTATTWTPATVAAMLFLGLVSSALCFLLFFWLLIEIEPYQLSSRFLLMPIVAMAEGILFLHEAVSPLEMAGGATVLISLALVLSAERQVEIAPGKRSSLESR